jgi:hypothetical protein
MLVVFRISLVAVVKLLAPLAAADAAAADADAAAADARTLGSLDVGEPFSPILAQSMCTCHSNGLPSQYIDGEAVFVLSRGLVVRATHLAVRLAPACRQYRSLLSAAE